jgi:TnpA family transposase
MPGRILTAAERERLDRFPEEISNQDILTHFTLSPMDKKFIGERRGEHNRLGVALQLMALRYLGFCPKELNSVPTSVVNYVAKQLEVSPGCLSAYGTRDQTRTAHLQEIQVYLGFRQAKPEDLEMLAKWLVDRAMEHDKPTLLLQLAAQKLQAEKIVRIGITRLEQMVAAARQLAHKETFQRLEPLLTQERQVFLDSLLLYNPTITNSAGRGTTATAASN